MTAATGFAALTARLKACPSQNLLEPEFLSSLRRGKSRLYTNPSFFRNL